MPPRTRRPSTKRTATSPALSVVPTSQDQAEPEAETVKPKTILEAAESGTQRDLLAALRTRLAKAVQDPNCPPRDLAALSRRLIEVAREIEALDTSDGDDEIGNAVNTPDGDWDASAI